MTEKMEEQGFKDFKNSFLASNNYILLGSYDKESIYLKNYSTMVCASKTGKFLDFPGEEMEEKVILENPTEEEKIILATTNSPGLLAIEKGRKILETKSKEEAVEACKVEVENAQKKIEKYQQAKTIVSMEEHCSASQIAIFRQFHGQEYPTVEEAKEMIETTNLKELTAQSKLSSLTLGYLDGSLYQESLNMVQTIFDLDKTKEKTVVQENEEKIEEPQQQVEAVETQTFSEEVKEEVPVEENIEKAEEPVQTAQVVETPEIKEEVPDIQIPIVGAKEPVEPAAILPAVETPSSTLPEADYAKMVADVVSGGEPNIPAIQELLNPKSVPIEPATTTQVDYTVPSAQETVIEAPASLEQMVQDTNVPSFDGPIGGRTM